MLATEGIFNLAERDITRTNYPKVKSSKSSIALGHSFLGAQTINHCAYHLSHLAILLQPCPSFPRVTAGCPHPLSAIPDFKRHTTYSA